MNRLFAPQSIRLAHHGSSLLKLAFLAALLCMGRTANATPPDTDGDGIEDSVDIDDDNDGLLDVEEDVNSNGTVQSWETDPLDADTDDDGYGDGIEFTQGSDPLDPGTIPEHRDPNRPVCFDDRPQDQGQLSGSPLMNLTLGKRSHFQAFPSDKLVVSEGATVQLFHDPNDLEDSVSFTAPSSVTGISPIVLTEEGTDSVFLVSDFAEVQRWDLTGSLVENEWSADAQRGGCAADRLAAPPLVQLRRFSSAAFQTEYTTDLVYVATRFSSSCAGQGDEDNQIIAYNGATGAVEWTFNALVMGVALYDMDVIDGGMTKEQGSDILFVGSERQDPTQDSLWAINVVTGALLWSVNVGPVRTKPQLMDDQLYVSTTAGEIKAITSSTGATRWTISNGGTPTTNDPHIIKTAAGEVLIASVDTAGKVWVVRDDDFFGSELWSINPPDGGTGGPPRPSLVGLAGEKLYIGGNDGRIYQLDLASGAVEASRLAVAGEAITDLAIQEKHSSGRVPSLFATTDGGRLLRFCLPFRTNTHPLDTDGDGVTDGVDNAPNVANPGQADSDQDGLGDVSDPPNLAQAQAAYSKFNSDPFSATPEGGLVPNGVAFFLNPPEHTITSLVTVNLQDYAEVSFQRSRDACDVQYHLNYSPDLVNWNVAQDGVNGVVVNVHAGPGEDTVTVRIPVDPSGKMFSHLTLSIGTP